MTNICARPSGQALMYDDFVWLSPKMTLGYMSTWDCLHVLILSGVFAALRQNLPVCCAWEPRAATGRPRLSCVRVMYFYPKP